VKKTPLKRTVGLKVKKINSLDKTRLKPKSDKQKERDKEWAKVKQERIGLLIAKYGYLPDEYTGEDINHEAIIDGHHNDRNRNHNILSNCRIVKRFSHTVIHDNNIKDVKDWLNMSEAN
jgi:hypothetical protein